MTLSGKTAPFSKDLHKKVGIYQIVCRANGKAYVGGSVNLGRRKIQHCFLLREGRHYAKELQRDWELYGCESFDYEILEFCETLQDLARLEEYWILKAGATNPLRGYNHSEKSLNPLIACNNPSRKVARRMSAEERLRLSEVKDPVYFLEKYGEEELISLSIRTLKKIGKLLRVVSYSLLAKQDLVDRILEVKGNLDIAEVLLENCPVKPQNKKGRKRKPTPVKVVEIKKQEVYWLCSPFCVITKVEGFQGLRDLTGQSKQSCKEFVEGKASTIAGFRLLGWEDPISGEFKKSGEVLEYRFVSPRGELSVGTSCKEIAIKNGLAPKSLGQIKNGYTNTHRGWTFLGSFDVLTGMAAKKTS